MRSEEHLLLACASAFLSPQQGDQVATLASRPTNWTLLVEIAQRHHVLPIVYRTLAETCPEAVPELVMAGLRRDFADNAKRNLSLAGDLLRVLTLLEAARIPSVPFKGPTLAAQAYGDLALREFADNDLMIRLEDMPRARDVLLAEGYRPEIALTPAQEAAYMKSRHSLSFIYDHWSIIELHWAVQPRYFSFDMDPARLWARLRPVDLAGRSVMTFSGEDLLLILSLHGTKHLWSRLEWVCDLALLAGREGQLDWDRVLGESRRLGARRMLLLGLRLVRDLLSLDLAPEVEREAARDLVVPGLAAAVRRRLFAPWTEPGIVESSVFFVRARERLADRVRYCSRLMTTPYVRDWATVTLPDAASALYYVIRPFRMMVQYTAAALRRL